MSGGFDQRRPGVGTGSGSASNAAAPGKSTLVQASMARTTRDLVAPPVQLAAKARGPAPTGELDGYAIHHVAATGVAGAGGPLPHGDRIQLAFGRHDVSGIEAHVGGGAETASRAIGAEAYATGNHVAFAGAPSLHIAAHEAAHVVQQRGGVQLKGGVGTVGDAYEQHADAVADAVVQGRSAEGLLDPYAPSSGE